MSSSRAIAIGLGLVLMAGGPNAVRGQEIGGVNLIELFQQLDANGDMVIEKGEVPESGRPAFEQLVKEADKDKDGKIDREEYRDLLLSLRGARPGMGMNGDRFKAMDKNNDGKLSKDEFQGPPPLFARIDADHDGFITQAEGMRFAAVSRAERFKAMDSNGDGKLTKDEFTGPQSAFQELDANKDGFLSKEETSRMPLPGASNVPGPFFRAMDTDGNGKIDRKEFTGPAPAFNRLDADRDGTLSLEEFRGGRLGAGAAPKANAKAKAGDAPKGSKTSSEKAEK